VHFLKIASIAVCDPLRENQPFSKKSKNELPLPTRRAALELQFVVLYLSREQRVGEL